MNSEKAQRIQQLKGKYRDYLFPTDNRQAPNCNQLATCEVAQNFERHANRLLDTIRAILRDHGQENTARGKWVLAEVETWLAKQKN